MTITLSESARDILRRRYSGERVEVTDHNLDAYRELVAAGVMYPVSTFTRGPESNFRFTEEGWNHRDEWLSASARPIGSP